MNRGPRSEDGDRGRQLLAVQHDYGISQDDGEASVGEMGTMNDAARKKHWSSFEEARDLLVRRSKMSIAEATELLVKEIKSGKMPIRPADITVRGIEVFLDETWLLLGDAHRRVMTERV